MIPLKTTYLALPQPHLRHLAATSSLTGTVPRFPEEVREGDAANHDVLLLELDQRLLRYQTSDGIQAPEDVQDDPCGPRRVVAVLTDSVVPPAE